MDSIEEAIMPNAYHRVSFTIRDGISDNDVIERFRRYRNLAVGKGYIKNSDDFSVGKVVIPAGGDDEVAKARQTMTGGFTWVFSVRLDGREGLDRFLQESVADIHAVNLMELFPQPLAIMVHDHVDQLG